MTYINQRFNKKLITNVSHKFDITKYKKSQYTLVILEKLFGKNLKGMDLNFFCLNEVN